MYLINSNGDHFEHEIGANFFSIFELKSCEKAVVEIWPVPKNRKNAQP
jgi:hypothetical protein